MNLRTLFIHSFGKKLSAIYRKTSSSFDYMHAEGFENHITILPNKDKPGQALNTNSKCAEYINWIRPRNKNTLIDNTLI